DAIGSKPYADLGGLGLFSPFGPALFHHIGNSFPGRRAHSTTPSSSRASIRRSDSPGPAARANSFEQANRLVDALSFLLQLCDNPINIQDVLLLVGSYLYPTGLGRSCNNLLQLGGIGVRPILRGSGPDCAIAANQVGTSLVLPGHIAIIFAAKT